MFPLGSRMLNVADVLFQTRSQLDPHSLLSAYKEWMTSALVLLRLIRIRFVRRHSPLLHTGCRKATPNRLRRI